MIVEKSDTLAGWFEAMAGVQAEMKMPKKSASGQIGRDSSYKYADLNALWIEWLKVGPKAGFSVNQGVTLLEDGRASCDTMVGHSSGEYVIFRTTSTPPEGNKGINRIQAAGSGFTYTKRYAFAAAVGLVDEHDDDGRSSGAPTDQRGNKRKGAKPSGPPPKPWKRDSVAITKALKEAGLTTDQVLKFYYDKSKPNLVKSTDEDQVKSMVNWAIQNADRIRQHFEPAGGEGYGDDVPVADGEDLNG